MLGEAAPPLVAEPDDRTGGPDGPARSKGALAKLIASVRLRKATTAAGIAEAKSAEAKPEPETALGKREDEKAVTERAYENPVFVEDLLRNVALRLNADRRVTWYKVEAENHESIHNHNAYACIEKG